MLLNVSNFLVNFFQNIENFTQSLTWKVIMAFAGIFLALASIGILVVEVLPLVANKPFVLTCMALYFIIGVKGIMNFVQEIGK